MSLNAYDVLCEKIPALIPTLNSNHSVCEMLQAFYTYVAHQCATEGINVSGLGCAFQIVDTKMREDKYYEAKIQIDFTRDPLATPNIKVGHRILWQRNLVIVKVMEVNSRIRDLARVAVAGIESWAAMHNILWVDIRCGRKIIVRRGGNRMEIELGQKQWLKDEEEGDDVPPVLSN